MLTDEPVPPYQKRKPRRPDTRTLKEIVPEEWRIRVGAHIYGWRRIPAKERARCSPTTTHLFSHEEEAPKWWYLRCVRLWDAPRMIADRYGKLWPHPSEVAPCCWSTWHATHSSSNARAFKYGWFKHVNSAAHIAQHLGVKASEIIREERVQRITQVLRERK